MNMKQLRYIAATVASLLLFTACEQHFDRIPDERAVIAEDSPEAWQPTLSILDLIENYDDDNNKGEDGAGLFTINPIDAPEDVIVRGRIITDDAQGNVYKYIVIQSLDDDRTCLKISIDAGSISGMYPLGQVINVKCNGLIIGHYAGAPQLGVRGYRNDNKIREEPGRIPYTLAMEHIQKIGLPDPDKIVKEKITLKEITQFSPKLDCFKIVEIENVYFTGYNDDGDKLNSEIIPFPTDGQNISSILDKYELNPTFAPSTYSADKGYNIGFPRSREIKDGSGATDVYISTSEYARFADHRLPKFGSSNTSTITAIVGWYQDNAKYDGSWQLTIRSLSDLGDGFVDINGKPYKTTL